MKKRIITFIIVFLLPCFVNANTVSLVCDNNTVKGNSVSCRLSGDSNKLVTALSAKVRTGSNISFSSFQPAVSWQGDGEEGSIDLYTAYDINGNFVIGTINFEVNQIPEGSNTTITIDSIYFYDEDGNETSVNAVVKNIRLASSVNDLSSLTLSNGKLNPSFSSDVTSYSTTIDADSVNIEARAKDSKSTISGNTGKVSLKYGHNNLKITITSENGNQKTYNIDVYRPNNSEENNDKDNNKKSDNAYLKSIVLSNGNINFNKKVYEYSISAPHNVINIDVDAVSEDSKAKVEVSGNKNLIVGNNKILIKVTAENNATKTYTINVERKEENATLSNNNYASNIKIEGYDINFDKNKNEYTLKLKQDKELTIEVSLEDDKSKYEIQGNSDLKNDSVVKVIVTSEDGKTRTYNINIKSNNKLFIPIFIVIITVLLLVNIIRIVIKYKNKKSDSKI